MVGSAAVQPPNGPQVAVRAAADCAIPGLALLLNFVSAAEEAQLLRLADAQPHWQLLAKRRVLHFGRTFDYETRGLGPVEHPLPPALRTVADRVEALPGCAMAIDQLTVNEYAPGVGISPHVETHSAFTGAIASLSLAGPAAVVLRREGHPQRSLFLPPRSLLLLAGEARYCWQHYIPHRKTDVVAAAQPGGDPEVVPRAERRVSFTFRQARGFPCDCAYAQFCDSQLAPLEPTRMALKRMQQQQHQETAAVSSAGDGGCLVAEAAAAAEVEPQPATQQEASGGGSRPADAGSACAGSDQGAGPPAAANDAASPSGASLDRQLAALETRYVHSVYDAIAPHFAATRFAVWPRVRAFLEGLPPGALLADVGCGNGKYFGVRRDLFVAGSDRSEGLARVAARRLQAPPLGERLRADVAVADGLALPFRAASCDGALCIAVLHHIASPPRRLALLAQLLRILRPGGRALVTVWATEQGNMSKVRSWQPVSTCGDQAAAAGGAAGPAAQPAAPGGRQAAAASPGPQQQAAEQQAGPGGGAASEAAVASGDYFVPWHLPFHRAEAAAAVRQAQAGAPQQASDGTGAAAGGGAPGGPRLDGGKGAVVYQRYYHLFERGELDTLVGRLPGAALVDSFYDKDNWCCVFQRL